MSFRLYINGNRINKFYGYVKNIEQLRSYQFLKNKKYIKENKEIKDSMFDLQSVIEPFAISHKDFKSFIKLYNKDMRLSGWQQNNEFIERKDIQKELRTKENKMLEWC